MKSFSSRLLFLVALLLYPQLAYASLVITWGDSRYGGDLSSVQPLSNVATIYSTGFAFAAVHNDGSVTTWGYSSSGGDSSSVQPLSNVATIYSTDRAFAAVHNDGNVTTWGDSLLEGIHLVSNHYQT